MGYTSRDFLLLLLLSLLSDPGADDQERMLPWEYGVTNTYSSVPSACTIHHCTLESQEPNQLWTARVENREVGTMGEDEGIPGMGVPRLHTLP